MVPRELMRPMDKTVKIIVDLNNFHAKAISAFLGLSKDFSIMALLKHGIKHCFKAITAETHMERCIQSIA